MDFVEALRAQAAEALPHRLTAIEYFDANALRLVRAAAASGVPRPPADESLCAVYTEWALTRDLQTPEPLLCRLLAACGSRARDAWTACDAPALEKMKAFRHAVPEQVNACIAERKRTSPGLTKLGTDLSVPDNRLRDVLALYRRDLAAVGFEQVIFGHIGDNHLHVNILPRDANEYETGRALYRAWAEQVVAWGGSVSAEHGIGRLKKPLLAAQYGMEGIAAMRRVKAIFDPQCRLNPGRLFD